MNTDVTLARVVAPMVSEYVLTYPEVSIELIMTDQIGDLVAGAFDLAIQKPDPRLDPKQTSGEQAINDASDPMRP